jgi:hypothetical protein
VLVGAGYRVSVDCFSKNSDAAAYSRRAAWLHDRHRNDAGPETTKEGDDEIQSGREH